MAGNNEARIMAHVGISLLAYSGHFGLEDEIGNSYAASHPLHNITIFKTTQGRKQSRGQIILCWLFFGRLHEAVRSAA